jgi:DNA replication protein DnaC
LDELYASLADRSTPKLIKRLCNYPILLIDELRYLALKAEQINAFFVLACWPIGVNGIYLWSR